MLRSPDLTSFLKPRGGGADVRSVRVVSFLGVALALFVGGMGALLPQLLRHRQAQTQPVFNGSTSIYAVSLTGGTPREVVRLHGQWAFPLGTRDGKALLVEHPLIPAGTELWRVPLDGSARTLVGHKDVFTSQVPTSGPYRAFEKQTRPASTGWRMDLHVLRAGVEVWSRRMPFPAGYPAVSRDGSTVAMVRMHLLELWTRNGHRVLADDVSQGWPPLWSKDGRSLVYETYSLSRSRIVVRNVRTGAWRAIARGRYFEPALSRDGRTVYFLGMNDAVSIPK